MELKNKKDFISGKEASKILGCCQQTLRKYADNGIIEFKRFNKNGKRFYNIKSFINDDLEKFQLFKKSYIYCRVSSKQQIDDLQRQINFMKDKYPNIEVIQDIGSGINWKRRGFLKILKEITEDKIDKIYIKHKDRLCRFSFELIDYFCNLFKTKIIIYDKEDKLKNIDEELAEDLLSIITVFSCKKMGRRNNKIQKNNSIYI